MNTDAPFPDADMAWVRVQRIQTKLHQWASDDPDRRFDDLWNLVYDPAVLVNAWQRVRSNRGARSAGVDGESAFYVSVVRGEQAFLSELRDELKARRFQPVAVRAESVKAFETSLQDFFCVSVLMVGLLIQATVGSLGGVGRRPQNRRGLAA